MIMSSVRARIASDTPGALTWAREIAAYIQEKTGNKIEVLARMGATQDIVWLQRFPDLGAYEKSLEAVQSDTGYQALVKDEKDKVYPTSTDKCFNFGKYGFAAVPASWDSTGVNCFILNQGANVFRRDFGSDTVVGDGTVKPLTKFDKAVLFNYPKSADLKSWGKVE